MIVINDKKHIVNELYWKDLLKISSKILNPQILIFYFALSNTKPCIEPIKDSQRISFSYQFISTEEAKDYIVQSKVLYKTLYAGYRRLKKDKT